MRRILFRIAALGSLAGMLAVSPLRADAAADATPADTVSVDDVRAFLSDAERQLEELQEYQSRVQWVQANFITDDTNWLVTRANAEYTTLAVQLANATKRFDSVELPADVSRRINLLKFSISNPAPGEVAAVRELEETRTRLRSAYATGKGLYQGVVTPRNDLEDLMRSVRNPDELLEMWTTWREVSPPMRDDYIRMSELVNEGARELGFADLGAMWRSKYDMPADEFAMLVDRLWEQVRPLYESLHCYTRSKLAEFYGEDLVAPGQPIPAHLLGNMWAQEWGNLYPLLAPEDADPGYNVNELLVQNDYDAVQMAESADRFFVSIGFEPLPETFWTRSLFVAPRDREVVCHASAWDIDGRDDIRIKMCTKINLDEFRTMHHEVGHNIYQRAYKDQPFLYRDGANDGFHEAIGDMIALSITPAYLKQIGLIDEEPGTSGDVGLLLQSALDKVAFMPFGLLIDKWRWQVYAGEVGPEDYNSAWWKLRADYQGVAPPVLRTAEHFDPGAKFHVPNGVSYIRYFLAHVLQFQFYQSACEIAGWEGPLHRCSIFGNREVGERFAAMLEMGASKSWPDALEVFTGSREIDASAVKEYFAPLQGWLDEQNQGATCGW
jgi:peptidyl-dipeptidase A